MKLTQFNRTVQNEKLLCLKEWMLFGITLGSHLCDQAYLFPFDCFISILKQIALFLTCNLASVGLNEEMKRPLSICHTGKSDSGFCEQMGLQRMPQPFLPDALSN